MCTRDWQRHPHSDEESANGFAWSGLSYVTTLEADGTLRRRYADSDGSGRTASETATARSITARFAIRGRSAFPLAATQPST